MCPRTQNKAPRNFRFVAVKWATTIIFTYLLTVAARGCKTTQLPIGKWTRGRNTKRRVMKLFRFSRALYEEHRGVYNINPGKVTRRLKTRASHRHHIADLLVWPRCYELHKTKAKRCVLVGQIFCFLIWICSGICKLNFKFTIHNVKDYLLYITGSIARLWNSESDAR